MGFAQQEVDAFRALMIDMDADMVKVKNLHMTQLTLQEARTHCPLSAAGLTGVPHPQIITCTRQLLAGS